MSKILLISDVHHKTAKADAILAHEWFDQVIWGGDYQDDFHDTPEHARRTALWLRDKLDDPRNIMLQGNHDVGYLYFRNRHLFCSGFEHLKKQAIYEAVDEYTLHRLKWYHAQDGILITHAGLSAKLIKQYGPGVGESGIQTIEQAVQWLDAEIPKAEECAMNGRNHFIYQAGWSRGGSESVGGVIWEDFDVDMLATPFPQIVFHTPHPHPLFHLRKPKTSHIKVKRAADTTQEDLDKNWWVLDMDTHLDHYAILEDGTLTIKEISWSGLGNKNVNYSFEIFKGKING